MDNDSSDTELEDNSGSVEVAKFVNFSVHAGEHVSEGFSDSHDETEEFGGGAEAIAVHLRAHVDINDLGSGKELHDHGRSDNGGDTQLHECSLVRCQNDT